MPRQSHQRALVTGGTSGIGEAIVTRLAADGARVVFTGRDEARGAAVAQSTGAEFVRADVRDAGAVTASVEEAVALLGGLEVAVLNAGVLCTAPLSETTDEQWDTVMSTNLVAPFRYAREVLPALRKTGGSIVLVASDAGVWGETPIGAYSVSKRAVIMLTRMLAVEAGPHGVRVNAVCPGDTEPGMVTTVGGRDTLPDTSEWTRPPLGRLVHARDVAAAVAFLASEDARTITGADLLIDGGMRAALRANTVDAERAR
ncbi:MAG: meso-butanediol dehydrogenase / (S,S)-butanediol dehydrogenase / diacetyl reductase [Gaiellales bacterium]|jgi:NAD(P)-dependent dehydrogenase (short-subunit alcohol dehydrogenase family)|nr:meso-butanediol dehydrogenase / (S,S)-butanediol dehydrogenase / diacetyl reductase [Gaiellales bacterium]